MRRPKILQLFNRYEQYGGEEKMAFAIGEALRPTCDVTDFITSTAEFLDRPWWRKLAIPRELFSNPATLRRLEALHATQQFDFWQVHNVFPAMSPAAYQFAFQRGIPVLHFLHNYRFGCANGAYFRNGEICMLCRHGNFWPALIGKSWRNSHLASGLLGAAIAHARSLGVFEKVVHWIAISERQKQLHVEMGIPAGKISVVPHFYEPTEPPPPSAPDGYALFLGRLSPEKGVLALLNAWKILGRDRRLVIAGEGPERPRLETFAREHGLSNVTFTGFVSEAEQRSLWADSAFLVVPSVWEEPFGMVVLEAWARARPVIAHRIGALSELIDEGHTGSLADPANPANLATVLAAAFDSPLETSRMGAEALSVLKEKFTRARWSERMRTIHESILSADLATKRTNPMN